MTMERSPHTMRSSEIDKVAMVYSQIQKTTTMKKKETKRTKITKMMKLFQPKSLIMRVMKKVK